MNMAKDTIIHRTDENSPRNGVVAILLQQIEALPLGEASRDRTAGLGRISVDVLIAG
jgi:hypothetical protein